MALEDFERELQASHSHQAKRKRDRSRSREDTSRRKHHHHFRHDRHHHRDHDNRRHRHESSSGRTDGNEVQGRDSSHLNADDRNEKAAGHSRRSRSLTREKSDRGERHTRQERPSGLSWMDAPSSSDIQYVRRKQKEESKSAFVPAATEARSGQTHFGDAAQQSDTQIQSQDAQLGEAQSSQDTPAEHEVEYTFGDSGSSWRMTRLKATYKQAEDSARPLDDVAIERYGDLRSFDDAREEERELDQRRTLGAQHVGLEKPSGDLYQERKLSAGLRRHVKRQSPADDESEDEFEKASSRVIPEKPALKEAVPLDENALNNLRARLLRAQLRKAPDLAQLQAEYDQAMTVSTRDKGSGVVVLNRMESRFLTGGRAGEIKTLDNSKRGRERGLVEENEDMSIEDMVRQERRTKFTNDGKTFAERIAKDAKFDNDLDYLDENATKLSKSVQKSDINLRNTAVDEYRKMKRILDTCPLCSHEDSGTPPVAPVVSLATRTFLTLPTSPEITPYGYCASIVPIQHRVNLLECDDDEWEEIRNFMKSLTRFYYSLKPARHVIFYENAAHAGRKRHASLEAVPLPMKYSDTASQFFKEAILSSDEEWTQHKKIIDTLKKAEEGGGKHAFRRSMVSELPYFHVWFRIDGGYGHVVEDAHRWPKGDLFAREIIGGMLDVGPEVIKRQGRWRKGDRDMADRAKDFGQRWQRFDWTSALLDGS